MSLGAAGSEELAYEMGRITALEGRAMGLHMTYAPVVDVNIDPDNPIINTRAVGEDPGLVGRIAAAFIRGVQDHGMIATAKHFPGHGDTDQDSHSLLPTIEAGLDRLERVELEPFRQAVEAGVKAVMTAHLFVPALDPTPGLPATLSEPILTGLLRERMGFRGLIVTDAIEMAGVMNTFSTEEASVRALLAGVDMLLLPPEPAKVIAHLAAAVREGRVPMRRVDDSVRRILEAKASLGLHRERLVDLDELDRRIAPKPFLEQAFKTFESSVTLVKNEGGAVPLAADGPKGRYPVVEQRSGRLLRREDVRRGDEKEVPVGGGLLCRRRHGARSPRRGLCGRLPRPSRGRGPFLQGQRRKGQRRSRAPARRPDQRPSRPWRTGRRSRSSRSAARISCAISRRSTPISVSTGTRRRPSGSRPGPSWERWISAAGCPSPCPAFSHGARDRAQEDRAMRTGPGRTAAFSD
jgi:beta-glucosidase-like glycosyl hydrolase